MDKVKLNLNWLDETIESAIEGRPFSNDRLLKSKRRVVVIKFKSHPPADNFNRPEKPDSSTVKDSLTVQQPSEQWVRNMAEKEGCQSVSVGGLASDLGMVINHTHDVELKATLRDLQHHNDEQVSNALHLLKQVEDMGLTVEQAVEACDRYSHKLSQDAAFDRFKSNINGGVQ